MLKSSEQICIYGTGFKAKFLYHYLFDMGKDIYSFVTTNKENKQSLYGKTIKQIWNLAKEENLQNIIFVVAVQEKYWTEIKKVLEVLGVLQEKIFFLNYTELLQDEVIANKIIESTKIYKQLQDEKSKILWRQGVKYRLTSDYSFFLKHIRDFYNEGDCLQCGDYISLADWLSNECYKEGKRIGMYAPSNSLVSFAYPRLKEMGIHIDCICTDNEKICNRLAYGVPVISLKKATQYLNNGWLIVSGGMKNFTQKTRDILCTYGFSEREVVAPCSLYQPFAYGKQYFDLQELKVDEEEVFVDAGCLDCSTDMDFIEWCKGAYRHIYAFEPDKKSCQSCMDIVREKKIKNITIVNKGLWDGVEKLCFSHDNNAALSKITENGVDEIETIALDEYLNGEKVTFIKMDIEGAELKALKGAEKTIKMHKPKLAISIYHKVNDFIDIPEYLLSLVPEYKFYIRHYSCYKFETILYAMT